MNKFAKKATAAAVTATMLFSTIAPAAATVITTDDGRYPALADGNAMVLELQDNTTSAGRSLQDIYKRINFAEFETTYELGEFVVYGNDNVDEDGPDFDQASFDLSSIGADLDAWGVVIVDNSNTADTIYRTIVGQENADQLVTGKAAGVYMKEILDITPRLDENKLEDMLKDAVKGTEPVSAYTTEFEDDLTTNFSNTSAQIGDPDALAEAYDEVYMYLLVDGEEYVFHMDITVNDTMDFGDNEAEVQNLKMAVRNQTGRVSFDLPENPMGLVDFVVEITDQDGAGDVEYITQNTVVFFPGTTQADESDYNVTVTTVDAEGSTSAGMDIEDYDEATYFETGDLPSDEALADLAGHTFEHHVATLYKLNIIDGYSNGDFGADDDVTRAQLAKFVVNAFGIPMDLAGEMFPDLDMGSTLFPYVQTLKNARIVGGYSNGNFGPDDVVTRGQATKFIYRAATFFDGDTMDLGGSISFDDTTDSVFNDYIEALASYAQEDDNGLTDENDNLEPIIKGYSDGNFGADDNLTRGQMSKMVLNAASMVEKYNNDDDTRLEASHLQDVFTVARDHDTPISEANAANDADENFFRPFIMPVAVDDIAVRQTPGATDSSVDLEWDALHLDDLSIDGYLVEYKKSDDNDDDWKEVETNLGAIAGEWAMTVNEDTVANGTVTVTLTDGNGNEAAITYTNDSVLTPTQLATDLLVELNAAVDNNTDATDVNTLDTVGISTHSVDLDADGNGDDFDFGTNNVDFAAGVNPEDVTVADQAVFIGDESLQLANVEVRATGGNSVTLVEAVSPSSVIATEGMVFVDPLRDYVYTNDGVDAGELPDVVTGDRNPYANMVTVDGLSDGTKYEFRVAAFKYVPVGWTGEQDIDDVASLEAAADDQESVDGVDYYEHLIAGTWKSISKTVDSD